MKDKLGICAVCNNISDGELCNLLPRSASRPRFLICVVEEPHNMLPIETTRQFNGLYHVLHGSHFAAARHRPGAAAHRQV